MKRGTRFFLLAGCALILFLEAPASLVVLSEASSGPYAGAESEIRSAATQHGSAAERSCIEVARR